MKTNKYLQNEDMKFYRGSRPNPEVEKDLKSGEHDYSKIKFPKHKDEQYANYEEFLASDEYEKALEKLARYTGISDIGTGTSKQYFDLSKMAVSAMIEITNIESTKKQELEELAEKIVRDYFQIPKNKLTYELKLNNSDVKIDEPKNKGELEKKEKELVNNIKELDEERIQRRLQNAMSQGLAVDKHWIFENAQDELIKITGDNRIIEKYGVFTSILMSGYWQMSKEQMGINESKKQVNEAIASGKSTYFMDETPPKIYAEAMNFPLLIHEALKGTMSFLGAKRKPENLQTYLKAVELEDNIKAETWDIRLGPAIWRKFLSKLPLSLRTEEDKRKLIFYLVSNVANLPAKEYIVLYNEIFSDSKESKNLLAALYYDMTRLKNKDTVSEEESAFKNLIKELADKLPNDAIGDMLAGMGIGTSK
jgi:hypothetical protein